MVSEWAYWLMVLNNLFMVGLNIALNERHNKLGKKYVEDFTARLHVEGELNLFKHMVGKLSPELLKMHEETMVEVHVSILSREGVGKDE